MVERNEGLGPVIEKYLRHFYAKSAQADNLTGVYAVVMEEVERRLISVTLETAKGNRLKTSKILGLNRNTLLKKMRLLNLDEKVVGKNDFPAAQPMIKRRRKK